MPSFRALMQRLARERNSRVASSNIVARLHAFSDAHPFPYSHFSSAVSSSAKAKEALKAMVKRTLSGVKDGPREAVTSSSSSSPAEHNPQGAATQRLARQFENRSGSTDPASSPPPSGNSMNSRGSSAELHDNADPYETAAALVEIMRDTLDEKFTAYYNGKPFDKRWDEIQQNLALLGRTSTGNKLQAYMDTGDAFREMWAAVDGAQKEALWQTYICKDDNTGRTTVAKLEAAQRRGVKTELLYDSGGNITGRKRLVDRLEKSGATVIHHRPFFKYLVSYFSGGMKWYMSPGLRNHRKILLVDSSVGFLGGLNIGDDYCGKIMGGNGRFRDTQCRVVGPAVQHLREVYDDTKKPVPSRASWIRWRQVASKNVKFHTGKLQLSVRNMAESATDVQRRSQRYLERQLQKAQRGLVDSMGSPHHMRRRWQRQRHSRSALHAPPRMSSSATPSPMSHDSEATITQGEHADHRAETPAEAAADGTVASSSSAFPSGGESEISSNASTSTTNKSKTNGAGTIKGSVMKERWKRARYNALYRATEIRNNRAYTQILRSAEVADTEPIPEAIVYGLVRAETTQIVTCNPHTRDWSIPYCLWQVTRKAHRRVWITTPYYMPHRKLTRAILHAARRGVDIRIVAGSNQTTDPWFMWHASHYITAKFLKAGVRIYEFKGNQIMHAKTVVVDSIWSCVGSYNWDMMSNKNMEVCVCHLGTAFAHEMETHFLADMAQCEELKFETFSQRSLWLRFTSWFFYVVLQILERITFRSFTDAEMSSDIDELD